MSIRTRMGLHLATMLTLVVAIGITGFSQQRRLANASLNEQAIRAHIKFLSSDLLEGRGTGARGGEIAANYIAAQMEGLGLKGAGANGSFFQPVSLVGVKADPNTKLIISGRNGKESFKFADDYVAFTGAQIDDVEVDADLVFVGYAWSVVRTSNGAWRFDIARNAGDNTPFLKVRSWITDEAARKMMKLAAQDLDDLRTKAASRNFQPVQLNLKGKISLKSEVKRVQAPNVVGILPGRDPKLRDEYVVYSAHWDHLGV